MAEIWKFSTINSNPLFLEEVFNEGQVIFAPGAIVMLLK
jgi:hypothetical protein